MSVALRAELGAVRWGPVAGAVALAVALAVLDLTVWPRGPLTALTWLAAALLAGASALALDEPRHPQGAAVPTGRRVRQGARLGVVVPLVLAWTAYSWTAARLLGADGADISWTALAVTGAALTAVAVGVAAALDRSGHAEPGGAVSSTVAVAAIGLFVVSPPGLHPYDVSGWNQSTAGWCLAGALGLLALWRGTRDAWT